MTIPFKLTTILVIFLFVSASLATNQHVFPSDVVRDHQAAKQGANHHENKDEKSHEVPPVVKHPEATHKNPDHHEQRNVHNVNTPVNNANNDHHTHNVNANQHQNQNQHHQNQQNQNQHSQNQQNQHQNVNQNANSQQAEKRDAPVPNKPLKFGSLVKILHKQTKEYLHSHDARYITGSYQQQVSCFPHGDENDLWYINPANKQGSWNSKLGEVIQSGSTISLKHASTHSYLHSHKGYLAPTGDHTLQEVSAFGKMDDNNSWKIVSIANKPYLENNDEIRIEHISTKRILVSHDKNFNVGNGKGFQQEVGCVDGESEEHKGESVWILQFEY